MFWGASIGTQFTGSQPPWDWNAATQFERQAAGGKGLSVLPFGSQFYSAPDCGGSCPFFTALFQKIREEGMIPWFNWQSSSSNGERGYTDAQIAAGAQDRYIIQWAEAAKEWGHPFFLRFDWEMNGSWFPWGAGANGNTPADYVAMWRHVHNLFASAGAHNVTWVWCPNIDPGSIFAPLRALYPGDSYVDWTCLDGYNAGAPWTSFQNLFSSSYGAITSIAPSKPVALGEIASTELGGSKSDWIDDMFTSLAVQFPQVHGLLWYDVDSPGPAGQSDWPLESSRSAAEAFAAGIASPRYAASNYGDLIGQPIAPPAIVS